jgi:L-alanine-DL-glutamate epimerase-like enolase superfamily enzyme
MHLWRPPFPGAPDPKMEVAVCRAVRERVGDEMALMLDSYHHYTREESLYIGRELEKLNYTWFEEPMDEYNVSSYIWLSENLEIPVLYPEISRGKMQTRAEWIVRNASDISRGGVHNLGGITPMMKLTHLCEAFGVWLEVHGGNPGNLQVLCAMGTAGKYYERGLLHPMIDYEEPSPWLNELMDPMDDEGFVHIPQTPGLGWNINFDYIRKHRVS